jgi:hypothetical protein
MKYETQGIEGQRFAGFTKRTHFDASSFIQVNLSTRDFEMDEIQ